jgi:hypothetical protein
MPGSRADLYERERDGVRVEGKDRAMMQLASRGDGARTPALAWRTHGLRKRGAPTDHDDLSLI